MDTHGLNKKARGVVTDFHQSNEKGLLLPWKVIDLNQRALGGAWATDFPGFQGFNEKGYTDISGFFPKRGYYGFLRICKRPHCEVYAFIKKQWEQGRGA